LFVATFISTFNIFLHIIFKCQFIFSPIIPPVRPAGPRSPPGCSPALSPPFCNQGDPHRPFHYLTALRSHRGALWCTHPPVLPSGRRHMCLHPLRKGVLFIRISLPPLFHCMVKGPARPPSSSLMQDRPAGGTTPRPWGRGWPGAGAWSRRTPAWRTGPSPAPCPEGSEGEDGRRSERNKSLNLGSQDDCHGYFLVVNVLESSVLRAVSRL